MGTTHGSRIGDPNRKKYFNPALAAPFETTPENKTIFNEFVRGKTINEIAYGHNVSLHRLKIVIRKMGEFYLDFYRESHKA